MRKSSSFTIAAVAAFALLVGSLAFADKAPKMLPITGRVVDLEVSGDARIVTVMAGSDKGVAKTWHARFLEGDTTKPLPDGEAIIIRIDKRTTIIKTTLTEQQIRANRIVQFDP